MDIKITNQDQIEAIQEANDQSIEPQQIIESREPGEMDYIAVKQVFEIDRDSVDYDDDINILARWAREQTKSTDPLEIKWAIRDLRMRLGTPTFGESIKHVARFAYLDMEEKRIKREKSSFS